MDLNTISTFRVMQGKIGYLSERAAVVSQNVANADTPGFKARDIKEPTFKEYVQTGSTGMDLTRTNPAHFSASGAGSAHFASQEISTDEVKPDGNNVSLDQQVGTLGDIGGQHTVMTNLYRDHLGLIKTALGNGS